MPFLLKYYVEYKISIRFRQTNPTAAVIDATTGAHLWADRFEGELNDIFALQDRMTESVIGAIAERASRKPTANLTAYDYYLRGAIQNKTANSYIVEIAL